MIILEELSSGHEPEETNAKSLQAALKRYCHALTKSHWDADDLAQDTWVKVLGYMKSSDSGSMNHPNPEALLFRMARNTWIDIVRRKDTFSRVLKLEAAQIEESSERGFFEIEVIFQALLEHLSPLQRTVLLLRDVFGYSGQEAAELLGTSEGAIKAALHRARQALPAVKRELLQAEGPTLPQDLDMQITLSRLAAAYEQGQITELMELMLADERQIPVMAVSNQNFQTYQSFQSCGLNSTNSTSCDYAKPGMRMVA